VYPNHYKLITIPSHSPYKVFTHIPRYRDEQCYIFLNAILYFSLLVLAVLLTALRCTVQMVLQREAYVHLLMASLKHSLDLMENHTYQMSKNQHNRVTYLQITRCATLRVIQINIMFVEVVQGPLILQVFKNHLH